MKNNSEVMQMAQALHEMADQIVTPDSKVKKLLSDAATELLDLRRALDMRNEAEGKAHALFTESMENGQRFAHTPEQCGPLGFVQVLRAALGELMAGKKLANPFIHMEKGGIE